MTGIRVPPARPADSLARARQSAVTQLAVSAWLAPSAAAAERMIASVPPKPMTAATAAATGIDARIWSAGLRNKRLDGADDQVEVLGPRQPVVAVGHQRDGQVVGRQAARQLERMRRRHVRVLQALNNMHRTAGVDRS